MRRLFAILVLLPVISCGGGNSSTPTTPTPTTPTVTKIINVSGNLNYGTVTVGDVRTDGVITISNTGNTTLTVSSLSGPCGSFFTVSWASGTIAPGGTQTVNVRFAPTSVQTCSGSLTVDGDWTSGNNTLPISVNIVVGYSKDLTGEWRGTIGFDTIITFTETSGNLSGVFNAVNLTGTVTGTVSNTGAVTFTVTIPGFSPFIFTGQADAAGNNMSGQVNGSGFVNAAASLTRVS